MCSNSLEGSWGFWSPVIFQSPVSQSWATEGKVVFKCFQALRDWTSKTHDIFHAPRAGDCAGWASNIMMKLYFVLVLSCHILFCHRVPSWSLPSCRWFVVTSRLLAIAMHTRSASLAYKAMPLGWNLWKFYEFLLHRYWMVLFIAGL